LLTYAEHPIVIADSRVVARFTAYRDRLDLGRQILRQIHPLKKRLADNYLGFYRKIQVDRQSVIRHFLIFGRHSYGDVIVALAPIVGFADIKTVNALGYDKETAIAALLDDPPRISSPFVSFLQKEIRGKAGVKKSSRGIFVFLASVFRDRQIESGNILFDHARVFVDPRIDAIYVTMATSLAELSASVPRIPTHFGTLPFR